MSPESFRAFCRFITGQLGIKMSEAEVPMLRSRLQRRLRVLGLPTLDTYRDFLFSDAGGEERIHAALRHEPWQRAPPHTPRLEERVPPTKTIRVLVVDESATVWATARVACSK